jgi:hypothetical protein
MQADNRPENPAASAGRKRTPAERAGEFAAFQAQLKHDAAVRRESSTRSPKGSGARHTSRGRRSQGG